MKPVCLLITCLSLLALSACNTTNTTGSRPQNPTNTSGASITKGMSQQAVRSAWGKPNEIRVLNSGKEHWIYKRPATAYYNFPINVIARNTRFNDNVRGSSIQNERVNVLDVDRTVVFARGKVEAWTQLRD